VNDFFYDLPKRLRNSHLVISRAGASTISELSLLGRPGILIPLPSSIDGDQEYNAKVLDSLNGAIVYHQSDINEEILSDKIIDLISSPSELLKIANNAKTASKGGGSKNIVDFIENLLAGKLVWR
jgi:UDP-N-acetylglucosamine--N-acetylmuramyl-(pentapeptide) pyrophosphoryl-undecaprenol N-acetylglucosamine transferase